MRFSLKRTVLLILVIVTLQLSVYYWVISPTRRGNASALISHSPGIPRLSPLEDQPPEGGGTCDQKVMYEILLI